MDDYKKDLNNLLVKINFDNSAIKYCVYRTALKLCCLQKKFNLTKVTSSSVFAVATNFCHNVLDCAHEVQCINSAMLTFKQLIKVVKSILNPSAATVNKSFDELANQLSALIYEMYKDSQEIKVALIAVVLFFIVMSGDELPMKYKKMYDLYSGSLSMLSRSRAGLLLTHLFRIIDIISESSNFGKVSSSVKSCFEGVLGNMVSKHRFLQWMLSEPQSMVWLPTIHRLNLSKSSIHNIQCSTCKMQPIVGMRFQCLKCLDFNSCQVCFLTQQNTSRSHKFQHPLQEYCLPAGNKEKLNSFARTVRNIVTKRYKQKPLSTGYLPIKTEVLDSAKNSVSSSKCGTLTYMAEEENKNLEKLVHKLKKENKKITSTVHMLEASTNEKFPNVDDDHSLLQSRLDTVTLHNQSLQAELDNLKCVVFSENFMPKSQFYQDEKVFEDLSASPDQDDEWNTTLSSDMSETISKISANDPQNSNSRKSACSKNKKKKKPKCNEVPENKEKLFEEDKLNKFVQQLSTSMCDNKPLDSFIFKEICEAADAVKCGINELIDSALKM